MTAREQSPAAGAATSADVAVLDPPAVPLVTASTATAAAVSTRSVPDSFRELRRRWPALVTVAWIVPLVFGVLARFSGGRLLVWDNPLTAAAVAHRTGWIDELALTVSRLGAWVVVFPVGALLAMAAARRSRELAWLIVITVAARPAVEWLLKEIVSRPRPDGARLVAGTGFSFPSGHVLAAAATWAFLPPVIALYTRRRDLWWASVAVSGTLVALIAWSRVWLGVHWTSDVVVSLAIAFLVFSAIESRLRLADSASANGLDGRVARFEGGSS